MTRSRKRTHPPPRELTKPRRRIIHRKVTFHHASYVYKPQSTEDNPKPSPIRITVRTLTPPPKHRSFRTVGGVRKFRLTKQHTTQREVIIVARAAKKTAPKKKAPTKKREEEEVEDEELEDLEDLEELDDLEDLDEDEEDEDVEDDDEDEDEDEDEDDEEEDDEDEEDEEDEEDDEEPAPKKSRKSKSTKSKQSRSRTTDGKVGTQEVADFCGIDARKLRMVLRRHDIPKDSDTNRYEWSSLKHPQVLKIKKLVDSGEAKAAQKEKLDNLKSSKGKSGKTSKGKAAPTKKTRKKA